MKNKLNLLLVVLAVHCAVVGNSAEPLAASKQATLPNQLPEAVSQTLQLQTKLDQVRAILSEINDLLKQEEKILAGTREQMKQAKKNEASLAEYNRVNDVIRQEIKKLRNQTDEAEKKLAEQAKQAEHYNQIQEEYAKAQKERADCEVRAQQAEDKLVLAQKNLAELKNKFAELTTKSNEVKKQAHDLENSAKALEIEKSRKEEALTRAEKAGVMAEKTEKERLLLAGRLAELEQNFRLQQKASSAQADIQSEIEKEKKAIQETEAKTRKNEKARQETENTITELKKQLEARQKTARPDSQKGDNQKHLQVRLEKIHERRIAAEEQFKEAEEKLKEREESSAALTNMIAAAEQQQEKDKETAKTIAILTNEIEKETALMNEVAARVDQQNRNLKALEDEKIRLNQSLILVKEKLGREEQNVSKLDEMNLQLAEQKKIRADLEAKLQQATRDQDTLEKEKEQLNRALIEAGNLILKNDQDFKKAGLAAEELQKEKELTQRSADVLREKEESVKKLAEGKTDLQHKLHEAETKLAQQKGRTKNLEASGSEAKETQGAASMTENSSKDTLSVEQDILNKARSGDLQPSGQDVGTDQGQGKKTVKQTGSRNRQNQLAQAEEHYELGIQKWDASDLDGAVAEFKKTIRLNPDAAGAYYNISLVYLRQGKKKEACDYACQAGECYLRIKNPTQAARMAVLMTKIDQNSPLIPKLRNKIAAAEP